MLLARKRVARQANGGDSQEHQGMGGVMKKERLNGLHKKPTRGARRFTKSVPHREQRRVRGESGLRNK